MYIFGIILLINLIQTYANYECPTVLVPNLYDIPNQNKSIRIMQYNVEWLFVDNSTGSISCPGECSWKNETEALAHLSRVAQVISEIKPDIINLCEVEGCDELDLLVDELNNRGANGYQRYMKEGTDTATGQNVAMITKYAPYMNLERTGSTIKWPISGSKCGYDGDGGNVEVSKNYYTIYNVNGYNILFVGIHLLSNPTDPERCAKREGQAQIIQELIADFVVDRGFEIILTGDFNDFDGDVLDWNDNIPTSSVLSILKGDVGERKGEYTLSNIAELISKENRFTNWWDSDTNCATNDAVDFSMIDHILVSSAISKHIVNAFIYHGYDEFCGKYDSDHYPLVIDLV